MLLSVGLVGLVWFGLGGWRCGAVGWFGLASFPLGVVWCGLAGVVWLGFGPVHVPAGMRFGLGRGFLKNALILRIRVPGGPGRVLGGPGRVLGGSWGGPGGVLGDARGGFGVS